MKFTGEIISYYHFLYRRRGYVLIDMGKLDEAETEFTKMLEDEVIRNLLKESWNILNN